MSALAWHSGLREPATGRRSNTRRRASFFRSHPLASARRFRRGLLSALLGLPLLFGFAASAQAQSTPGLEFSTTHLTWNESEGCGNFKYYDVNGNEIAGNTPQQRRQNAVAYTAPGNKYSTRGASMELPASAPGPTYKVKLKTKPSETVKVNIHDPNDLISWRNNSHRTLSRVFVGRDRRAANGRGGVGKPTLTFTPSNWDQWQTVKVKVACTDHFPDAVPLEHRMESTSTTGSGTRYAYPGHKTADDQRWKVWVRVHEQTPPVEIVASGLPPAGQTITLAEGATRDFKIRIGERMLPNGSSGRVKVHLYTEVPGNVLRATRRDGQPFADGTLHDTMVFESSSREQWVRLQAVGVGNARLVISAERDFTWAHETRHHWSPEWPVTVEHPGICGRTKEVRDAIVGKIPGVSHCRDVTPEHLAAISGTLGLAYATSGGTLNLQAGDFDGLTSLTHLDLEWNRLSTLPAGIFDDLTSLTRLDLDNNQFTALPAGIFARNTALTHLDLNNNQIGTLPAGIFDDLTALTRLDLDNNQITALPAGIFAKNTALNILRLHFNGLTALPDGIFARNTALTSISLRRNSGAPFAPTAPDAGPDQAVATGAQVTLPGTAGAGGPWGDNVTFEWEQVDGPASNTPVATGVTLNDATSAEPTFTAPSTAGELHFKLTATPRGFSNNQGMGRAHDWVTITVGAGLGSSAESAAVPTQAVANLLLATADAASATATWDAVAHATSYDVSWEASGSETAVSGVESVTATAATIEHNAQEAMTLEVTVTPEYVDENGITQPASDLAATATLAVGPESDALSASADSQTPACVSAELMADAQLAAGETWRTSPGHVERWSRVLAAFGEANSYSNNPMTIAEAQAQADRGLQRWAPVAPALECLANPPVEEAPPAEEEQAPPATPELSLSAGSAITEGAAASFTITADPAPATDLTVTYSVAQSGDYLAAPGAGARTVTLPAGTTSATLTVATADDTADEADGSVSVTLGTGTGYSIATGKGSGAVATLDNDEPVISITAGPGVTEGSPTSFTITANPTPAAPLDVALTITQSGDVAASGQTGSRTVTIPTTGTLSVTVATDDDAVEEADGSITATLSAGTGYSLAAAPANAASVAVSDNDAPSTGPAISIADATAHESRRSMPFTLTLSEPMAWPVYVRYATRDSNPVSAVAGQDYLAYKREWRLRAVFRPGRTETTIWIPLYNDSHDEDPETFEVILYDAEIYNPDESVAIADGVAVGTIINDDPMPAAFLSRFGRTVAQQALDGIESRIAADRSPGTAATIAGQALALGTAGQAAGSPLDDLLARQAPSEADPFGHHPPEPLSMTAREALLASSFTTTGEIGAGSLAVWGRAASSSFDGQEGSFSLDGTATTAMLGADYGRENWLLGLALLQSSGKGSYADTDVMPRPEAQICPPGEAGQTPCGQAIREGDGKVEASLTAVLPYASLQVPERRLRFWGALGYGTGEVTLRPETGGTLTADTSWQMAAAGMRAELTAIGSGALALTSDALWSRTRSDKTHALAASDATVTRLRAGMEASWQINVAGGGTLTPGLEVGARHDGGDAERGAGIEIGGSLAWSDPATGFAMDLSARKLIAHDDDDFAEHGLAASFIFDPRPDSARGLSVSLRQDAGKATGGVDALFMPQVLERQEGGGAATTAEAAYGLPSLAGRFTIAPHARLRMDDHARDYTLGWRLTPERGAPDLSLGLEATRREHGTAAPVHGVGVGMTVRW